MTIERPMFPPRGDSISRRTILQGAAALTSTVAATSPLSATAIPDAALIDAGVQYEKHLFEYVDATLEWAPALRGASAEVDQVYGADWPEDMSTGRARSDALGALAERLGADAASDRIDAAAEAMEPLAEMIQAAEASTLGGLRAKALVVLREAIPGFADHEGALTFSADDGGATEALFYSAAGLTGLLPMVRLIEARFAADAACAAPVEGGAA